MLALAGCGDSTNPAPEAAATVEPAAATAAPTVQTSRCEQVAQLVVDAISEGLTVGGGGTLRDARAVLSSDYSNVYFVSAEIDGAGMEGDGEIGTWATNSITDYGSIFSVDRVANEFSDWGDGGGTDARMSLSDDGAAESVECVSGR